MEERNLGDVIHKQYPKKNCLCVDKRIWGWGEDHYPIYKWAVYSDYTFLMWIDVEEGDFIPSYIKNDYIVKR